MKKKSLLLFLLGFINFTYSQKNFEESEKYAFINKFTIIQSFPLLFDQISLTNFDEYKFRENRLPYSKIKKNLVDEKGESFFNVTDTIFNRFYSIGRVNLTGGRQSLILAHVANPDAKERICEVYFSELDIDKNVTVFSPLGYSSESTQIATLVLENFDLIKMNFGEIEYKSYLYDETDKLIKLSNNDSFASYRPSYDDIPISDNLSIKFSREITMSLKNLIPSPFCIPYESNPITSVIAGDEIKTWSSYFLGAKKIGENRKIIFLKNNLKFNNFSDVVEINYMIIDRDNIIKADIFSFFYTDKEGRNYDKIGVIQDLKDKIILTSSHLKDKKTIEFIK